MVICRMLHLTLHYEKLCPRLRGSLKILIYQNPYTYRFHATAVVHQVIHAVLKAISEESGINCHKALPQICFSVSLQPAANIWTILSSCSLTFYGETGWVK